MTEDGGPRSERTEAEGVFLPALLDGRPWLDVWLHEAGDSTPWTCLSHDFSRNGGIVDTLRLDFDGVSVQGGWSPANLNWDDGVRALDANIDIDGPDGLNIAGDAESLAAAAGAWFDRHRASWRKK